MKKTMLDISDVIFHTTENRPISTLVNEFIRGEVNDAPAYQRPDDLSKRDNRS